MEGIIRTVRVEEFDAFMRFLERCFGHSKDFFGGSTRTTTNRNRPPARTGTWWRVAGGWSRTWGLYPIQAVAAGVCVPVGGIGGVATLPEERRKNHMSRLLRHVIGVMREQGFLVSGLGGDRQRYNAFGWESAGLTYSLRFSGRSMDRWGVKPVELQEMLPGEALETVARWQAARAFYARRPRLDLILQRQRLRAWIADEGYVIGYGEGGSPFSVAELVSASGRETAMIRAVLARTNGGEVHWTVSGWDRDLLARVLPCVGACSPGFDWTYRIVSLSGFLEACTPLLEARAGGLRDFDVSIGIHEHDRTDVASITLGKGKIVIEAGRRAQTHVEMEPVAAVRLILGGPPAGRAGEIPAALDGLFPVPLHVPPLDHV